MGYDDAAIAFFKNYKGEDIASIAASIPSSINAEIEGTLSVFSANTSKIVAKYAWEWSARPLLCGVTDKIACAWAGTNPSSLPMDVKIDLAQTDNCVVYYDINTGNFASIGSKPIEVKHPKTDIECSIPLGATPTTFAKSGYVMVSIVPLESGNPIAAVTFTFSYAHASLVVSPSFSISLYPPIPSINVELGEEMDSGFIIIYSDRTYEVY